MGYHTCALTNALEVCDFAPANADSSVEVNTGSVNQGSLSSLSLSALTNEVFNRASVQLSESGSCSAAATALNADDIK